MLTDRWTLDPDITFLNHGSFGACPKAVLAHQAELRARMEREPVHFFVHELPDLHDAARESTAAFVGADAKNFAFVRNATSGVNAVVRSLTFEPGDELLTTDHAYNACRNVLEFVAERSGARVVVVPIPFPIRDPDAALNAIVNGATEKTKLALIDHIASPTGLVLPLARIVQALGARGIDSLIDGAHAPGMLELDLEALGAAYYTANFHKWVCAPKGAGMLYVRPDRQAGVHPSAISHGFNSRRDRSRFWEEFDWTGTDDPSPWICVPVAIDVVDGMLDGGWGAVRAHNRDLVLAGRDMLCEALGIEAPAPDSMIGALASVPVPDGDDDSPPISALYADPLQKQLFDDHKIEVPIPPWPAPPKRLLRISAFLYNEAADYRRLADALGTCLKRV